MVCFTSSFLVLVILLLSTFAANGGSETTRAHGELKQKPCHLHFYFHDILDGRNATAVRVTNPPMVTVIDDLLTEGPALTSTPVGRAQGFYASACLQEVAFLRAMNLEMAVVEGTGLFLFARDYDLAKTHRLDANAGDAIVEYDQKLNSADEFSPYVSSSSGAIFYDVDAIFFKAIAIDLLST
ncbi:unnamed protein product [Musa hybrid cultivar]